MNYFTILFVLLSAFNLMAQTPFPTPAPAPTELAFESKDWKVEPVSSPRKNNYHAPTPTSIPNGRVIKTLELKTLLDVNKKVVVIDVLDSKSRRTVPGALWLSGAGDGKFFAGEKARFSEALTKITQGDKSRPLVFLCLNSECWLGYNAALYAIEAGFSDVIWFRGGSDAWRAANLESAVPESINW